MKQEFKTEQTQSSIEDNIAFFCDNLDSYNNKVQNIDTYLTMRSYINEAIKGIENLLDIGNGGVFDYDVSLAKNVVGLDLFLDKLPESFNTPPNVTLKTGSALDIPYETATYDGVMMVMLIHHIIGNTVSASIKNVEQCIDEAYRVLRPGGKMIIIESCVPKWFYSFEKLVFPLAAKMINRIMHHPATLQYPHTRLKSMLEKKFSSVTVDKIPLGRWVIIFGKKVPSVFTPVTPYRFVAVKE